MIFEYKSFGSGPPSRLHCDSDSDSINNSVGFCQKSVSNLKIEDLELVYFVKKKHCEFNNYFSVEGTKQTWLKNFETGCDRRTSQTSFREGIVLRDHLVSEESGSERKARVCDVFPSESPDSSRLEHGSSLMLLTGAYCLDTRKACHLSN